MKFEKKMYYIKKTTVTGSGKKKETVTEETSTEKEPKEFKKLERLMNKMSDLMDEI